MINPSSAIILQVIYLGDAIAAQGFPACGRSNPRLHQNFRDWSTPQAKGLGHSLGQPWVKICG
jgi:hypothetical protein